MKRSRINDKPGTPIIDRIKRRVEVDGNDCWIWTGRIAGGGYAYLDVHSIPKRAHRLAYEEVVGPIPEGLDLDHLCRVRHCVNPNHLEPVTRAENNRRGDGPRVWSDRCKTVKPRLGTGRES